MKIFSFINDKLFKSDKKPIKAIIVSSIILFILILFLHEFVFIRIISFILLAFLFLSYLSLYEHKDFIEDSLHDNEEKTQAEIENKTKELEAMTQLLTAKNKELEKRNYELQKHELTALKILEEMDISTWKLKRQSQILEDAKFQLEKRTNELSILYELSNSMGYVTDFENLFLTIFSSLTKASRLYSISMLLFVENKNYLFTSIPKNKEKSLEKILQDIFNALHPMINYKIKREDILLTSCNVDAKHLVSLPNDNDANLVSSNFPIIYKGTLKGILNFSIPSNHTFTDGELKLFQTIVNHVSNVITNIQQLIKKETTKMDMMVKSMADGVIMTNMHGEVLIINPSAKKILDLSDDRLEHNTIEDGARYFQIIDLMKRAAKGKKKFITKAISIQKPRMRFINAAISLVKSDDGAMLGIVAILKDVTKHKELDDMKSDFVSTVSHELRTPLSSIKEAVSLVCEETVGSINETQKRCLKIAKDEVERLARLINDVLDISKLESGKFELSLKKINVYDLMVRSGDTLKTQLKNKNIAFTIDSPKKLYAVADEDKIYQVFINLLSNAVKFTEEKGSIKIKGETTDKFIKVSVTDSGIGIHPQDIDTIFERFKQISTGIKRRTGGTGLGLAISKTIVEMHDGTIGVESEVDKGSNFWFKLVKNI